VLHIQLNVLWQCVAYDLVFFGRVHNECCRVKLRLMTTFVSRGLDLESV
jgi:hypothetical protein